MEFRAARSFEIVGLILAAAAIVAACGGSSNTDPGSEPNGTVVTSGDSATPATTATTFPPSTIGDAATTVAPGATEAGQLPDPCSLLTPGDIEAATGLPFGAGAYNADLSTDVLAICDWLTSGDEYATAQVLIGAGSGAYENSKAGASGVYTIVDVEIPGADAAYATEEGSLVGMSVKGMFLQVAYIPPGPGTVLEQTKQLAAEAVANL